MHISSNLKWNFSNLSNPSCTRKNDNPKSIIDELDIQRRIIHRGLLSFFLRENWQLLEANELMHTSRKLLVYKPLWCYRMIPFYIYVLTSKVCGLNLFTIDHFFGISIVLRFRLSNNISYYFTTYLYPSGFLFSFIDFVGCK